MVRAELLTRIPDVLSGSFGKICQLTLTQNSIFPKLRAAED
jgi:hypothetical protein